MCIPINQRLFVKHVKHLSVPLTILPFKVSAAPPYTSLYPRLSCRRAVQTTMAVAFANLVVRIKVRTLHFHSLPDSVL